jgi:predicted component of type VI protein secretion system
MPVEPDGRNQWIFLLSSSYEVDRIAMTSNAPFPQDAFADIQANRSHASSADLESLFLEVGRGRTDHPRRPVLKNRFLIGSGPECDLRLGGQAIPGLHSILHRDGIDVWLDAVADGPPLIVNGTATTSARLHDGDRVEIGEFQLTVRRSTAESSLPGSNSQADSSTSENAIPEKSEDLAALSAAELVSLIEGEANEVEQFDGRRQMGAAALLQAVAARTSKRGRPSLPQQDGRSTAVTVKSAARSLQAGDAVKIDLGIGEATDPRIIEEVYRVVQGLNEFSRQLEQRADQLTQQEASYATAASVLLDAQQKLSDQLHQLQEQIATLQAAKASLEPTRRAVA